VPSSSVAPLARADDTAAEMAPNYPDAGVWWLKAYQVRMRVPVN